MCRLNVSERIEMYEANCKAMMTGKCLSPAFKECGQNAFIVDPCEASLEPVSLQVPKAAQPAVPDQLEAEVTDLISHNLVVQRSVAASLPAPKEMALGSSAPVLVPVRPSCCFWAVQRAISLYWPYQ